MPVSEALPGDFTLVFNTNNGIAHPAALEKTHHEMLQAFLKALPVYVKSDLVVQYAKNELQESKESES